MGLFSGRKRSNPSQQATSGQPTVEATAFIEYGVPVEQGSPAKPFRLQKDLYDLEWNRRTDWQVMSDPRNTELTIYDPSKSAYKLDLRAFTRNRGWTRLTVSGRVLPLEVCFEKGVFYGRWVPSEEA